MSNKKVRVRIRIITYCAFSAALTSVYFIIRDSDWQGSSHLHTLMESIATLLALAVGILSIALFYNKRNNMFLFLGVGFLSTALLDCYHTIMTSSYFVHAMPSIPSYLIPWSWNASRFFLSLLMFIGWWAGKRELLSGNGGKISEKFIYIFVGIMTMATLSIFTLAPLPRAYYPEFVFGRPGEFIPAIFFLAALIGYLFKGSWKDDTLEHWIILSLIAGFMCQAMFMSFSFSLFDGMFDMAHLLKKASYICVLTGLFVDAYRLFVQEGNYASELQAINKLLEENIAEKRIILENTADGLITIDDQGVVHLFNPAAERIFGYKSAEVIGHNINMLQPEPYHSEHDEYLRNYLRTGEKKILGIGREVAGRRKDGTTFPLDLAISETVVNGKRIFTGLVRDITERKQSEEKLKSANEELQVQAVELNKRQRELEEKNREVEIANLTKSEFLANMSHELRTPLNSIIGFSEVLEDKTFGELNIKQKKYVGNIHTSGKHLLQLINEILDLSKVEAGKMDMNYEKFSISDAMRDVGFVIKTQLNKKNIAFETVIDEHLSSIEADRKKFNQIMFNLLSNAVKFTPPDGQITIKAERADAFARISVSDTGIGIRPEDQERIFAAFQQIDSKISRAYEGTGLGLPLTKRFVEMHGGKIWVESEFEKCSTFTFTIPLEAEGKPI